MGIGIGIDFGTSNSSVAVYDGERLTFIHLRDKLEEQEAEAEALQSSPAVGGDPVQGELFAEGQPETKGDPVEKDYIPTALYLDREHQPTVGQGAIDRYLRDNAGRQIELGREELGELEMTLSVDQFDAVSMKVETHALTDVNMPGRLFRGIKTWLGDKGLERVQVFNKKYKLLALLTPILKFLREEAMERLQKPVSYVHVGRPVNYSGEGEDANEVAMERFQEACALAGLEEAVYYPEPVAAALSYLRQSETDTVEAAPLEQNILCFDFGGGTLDLCILRSKGALDNFEVAATHGTPLGGDSIDKLVYADLVFPELGKGCEVKMGTAADAPIGEFRFYLFQEGLLNWQFTHTLNTPELRSHIRMGIDLGGENQVKLDRLRRLITRNLSYDVFSAIEQAKMDLSSQEKASITVKPLKLNVPITRAYFEKLMQEPLRRVGRTIDETLSQAGMTREDIDIVVRTGGSSRIPCVQNLMKDYFPGRVVEHRTYTGISAGLAIANWKQLNWEP